MEQTSLRQFVNGKLSSISRKLRQLGVAADIVEQAFTVGGGLTKPVKITNQAKKRMIEILANKGDRCVVQRSNHNSVIVYTMDGYRTMMSGANRLKQNTNATKPRYDDNEPIERVVERAHKAILRYPGISRGNLLRKASCHSIVLSRAIDLLHSAGLVTSEKAQYNGTKFYAKARTEPRLQDTVADEPKRTLAGLFSGGIK